MMRPIHISLLALFAGQLCAAANFDPPDLQLEYRLHRQYLGKKGLPVTPLKATRQEDYRLQNGDTLRSLSQTLYGDPGYWPGIWATRPGSPQLVRPGHTLQFLLGSEDETPAFRITEEEEVDPGGVERTASTNGNPIVEIPPPDTPPKPVLKLPPSFPEWQTIFRGNGGEVLDDRDLGKVQKKVPDRIWLTAYAQETPVQALGYFLENDVEAELPVVNQYVYVKLKRGQGSVGQKMLVVRDQGPIKRVNPQWNSKDTAYLVQIYAELELTEQVRANFSRPRDAEEFITYRALITRTTGLSIKDCILINGSLRTVDLDAKGERGSTVAQIIGSEKHSASLLYGPGDIVFLNKGQANGVEEGQLLDVFVDRTSRRMDTPVVHSPVPSGTVKIVKVTNRLSTAILVEAREGIQQGDEVREVSARRDDANNENYHRAAPAADDDDEAAPEEGDDLDQELDEI